MRGAPSWTRVTRLETSNDFRRDAGVCRVDFEAGARATRTATHAGDGARAPVADAVTPARRLRDTRHLVRNAFLTAVTIAGDRTFSTRPSAYALTALSSRTELFLAAFDALAIATLGGSQGHPRDGCHRSAKEGPAQHP